MACDEKVSNQLNASQKIIYANLLIKLYKHSCNIAQMVSFSNDNKKIFKRRIFIIMKGSKIKKSITSSILAFLIVVLSCPLIAFASTEGASQIRYEIVKAIDSNSSKQEAYMLHDHEKYSNKAQLTESIKIKINPFIRGSSTFDVTVPKGGGAVTNEFSATAGKGIKVVVSGDSASDSFNAGISVNSEHLRYVSSQDGSVAYTFTVKETGTYAVYFENTSDHDIHLIGTIYVNY